MSHEPTALRDRIARALIERIKQSLLIDDPFSPGMVGQPFAATEYDLADAVLAVRDDELTDLREERDAARLVSKGRTMEQYDHKSELERLRAAVARVRALAEEWASYAPAGQGGLITPDVATADAGRALLAALDVPADGEQGRS